MTYTLHPQDTIITSIWQYGTLPRPKKIQILPPEESVTHAVVEMKEAILYPTPSITNLYLEKNHNEALRQLAQIYNTEVPQL